MERGHCGYGIREALPVVDHLGDAHEAVRPDDAGQPLDRRQQAVLAGVPGWSCGEEHVGDQPHQGQEPDHRHVAPEPVVGEDPEPCCHRQGRKEEGHVDTPARVVVPAQAVSAVPEMAL